MQILIFKYHKYIMSDKVNELIARVKEHVHFGENGSDEAISEIQNQIDDKHMDIRNLFSQNLDTVIEHYVKYQQTISYQKRLESQCEDFSKRIQKAQQLSQYDEQLIQRSQKAVQKLRNKRKQYENIRQSVRRLKGAVKNVREDRYNNAIKLLNIYIQHQPKSQTPLKKTVPIFKSKIMQHLNKLMEVFGETNLPKQVEIGNLCFNKLQTSINEKTNIYHSFFGRNNSKNSMISRSSILGEQRNPAPLRFLKKFKNQEQLQKYVVRLNIQMNTLKQMKMICRQMGEQELFASVITKYMRKTVSDICEQFPCQTIQDLKKVLSHYIGFLLFRRQILAYFNLQQENKLIIGKIYQLINQQIKNLLHNFEDISDILKIKSYIDIFDKVIELLNIETKMENYSSTIGELFKFFSSYSLEEYERIINNEMNTDNFVPYTTKNPNEIKLIYQIFQQKNEYKFTSILISILQIFTQYYDYIVAFVKESQLNKSQLHDQLSLLFERILAIYGGFLVINDQPLQIAQGQTNLQYCQKIVKYYSLQLQIEHQYMRTNQFAYTAKFDTLIVELRRRMRELIESKIQIMMASYQMEYIWLPTQINTSHNDFIEWLLLFIKETIECLQTKNKNAHQELIYASFSYMAKVFWDNLSQCSQFNLFTIYNLERDLLFIYKFSAMYFKEYRDALDKMKSLQQFYSLLLTNDMQEILQKNKRAISYPSLNIRRIVPILKKYNRAKTTNGKVRDLRKRTVEDLVKKLQIQLK